MSEVNTLITLHGISVDIYRETKGSADAYGDRAVTWTKVATEKVQIQPAWSMRTARILTSIAGRIDASDFLGIFKSNSVVQDHDQIRDSTSKYEVVQITGIPLFGSISHKEAYLKLMTEG